MQYIVVISKKQLSILDARKIIKRWFRHDYINKRQHEKNAGNERMINKRLHGKWCHSAKWPGVHALRISKGQAFSMPVIGHSTPGMQTCNALHRTCLVCSAPAMKVTAWQQHSNSTTQRLQSSAVCPTKSCQESAKKSCVGLVFVACESLRHVARSCSFRLPWWDSRHLEIDYSCACELAMEPR